MSKIKFLILLLCGIAVAQQTKLTTLGPNGGIVSLLKGSLDDAVVFAVVQGNSLYRSSDGGENWKKVFAPNLNGKTVTINDIAFHPQSSNTILMATSIGLFASSDQGLNWTPPIPQWLSPKFSVAYVPANSNVVFGSDEYGVLRSNDGGKNWFPVKGSSNLLDRPIYKIAVHPSDSINIRVLASTGFSDTVGIFFTPNGGQTWMPFSKGLPPLDKRRIYALEIDTMGIGRTHFRSIIGTADGIYGMQTDQGDTSWNAITYSKNPISGTITGGTLVYERFDPISGQHLFQFFVASNASSFDRTPQPQKIQNGVFRIDSRFSTIFPLFGEPPIKKVFNEISDILSIFVSGNQANKKIYIGTSAGIFVSQDLGESWLPKNNGISEFIIRNLASLKINASNRTLFAGIYGAGVYRSMDDGVTWKSTNGGISTPYITTVRASQQNNLIYAGSVYALYRSSNFGLTWDSVFLAKLFLKDPVKFTSRDNEMTVRISPKNPNTLLVYTKATGLYLSKDGAVTWTSIKSPLPVDTIGAPEHFEFDPVDSLTIYYGGYGLHKSTDLGQTWSDVSGNLPKAAFSTLLNRQLPIASLSPSINAKNNKEILIATVFGVELGEPFKIFKTINGGAIWNQLSISGFQAIYDRFDDKRLIVSGPVGIFGSDDGGLKWKIFNDSLSVNRYLLLTPHETDQNIFYLGSETGAHKLEYFGYPRLTIDTTDYDFGSMLTGRDSVKVIYLRNTLGLKKLFVQFSGLSDTISFRYLGPKQFEIPAGGVDSLRVKFTASSQGLKIALLKFTTSDPLFSNVVFSLRGHVFTKTVFDRLLVDFGSVTVGKDSILSIAIDNEGGLKPITLNYSGKSGDSLLFDYLGQKSITIDSGATTSIKARFVPKISGEKIAYLRFTSTDPRFPIIQYRLRGIGVVKNFTSRKILLDTTIGFTSYSGSTLAEYYKLFTLSLERAEIKVHYQKVGAYSNYSALLFVQPNGAPPKEIIDSLQKYIVNGGSVILAGDFGTSSGTSFNAFLQDSGWITKYKTPTGIKFNSNLLFDSLYSDSVKAGIVIAKPWKTNLLTYKVDSVITLASGSLSVDTSLRYTTPLLAVKSPTLYSVNMVDTSYSKISNAWIAATSKIGKGKIVAIADYDIWWNGFTDDTVISVGIFSGKNLQFAFTIFGIVDNLMTQLLEPTPQEEYQFVSIPYSFVDSSVEALFKDLGKPNKYLWRMFGKYNQRKGYSEFPEDFRLVNRGEGYWIITKEKINIVFGTTSVQGTEDDFEIILNPGYNMIGNPFPYDVSWKNSYREDSVESVLWSFVKGDYDSVTQTMEKFKGYWVKNNGKLPKVIRISAAQISTSLPKGDGTVQVLNHNEWKIQIGAQSTQYSDSKNFVGMLNTSVDGLDINDFSEPPPAPTNYLSLAFKNSEGKLAADYRAININGNFWDFEVLSSKKNISFDLSFNRIGLLDPTFKIYLLDNKQERVYDISQMNAYSIQFDKNESGRSFRILVGSEQFVAKNTNGIPLIPVEYALFQNFPNPFNPTTTIQYSIAHSGNINFEIFNVLGQKIKTLVNEFRSIGTYSVHWDGKSDDNMITSSGIYYYRIRINEFTSIKKMTFIK